MPLRQMDYVSGSGLPAGAGSTAGASSSVRRRPSARWGATSTAFVRCPSSSPIYTHVRNDPVREGHPDGGGVIPYGGGELPLSLYG